MRSADTEYLAVGGFINSEVSPVWMFPIPEFVRDFTDEGIPSENLRNRPVGKEQEKIWRENYIRNNSTIMLKNPIKELFGKYKDTGDTALIVGCGPSLEQTAKKLIKRDDVKIITTNSSMLHVDPAIVDYHMMLDYEGRDWWLNGVSCDAIPLICSVFVAPKLLLRFKNIYFFSNCIQPDLEDVIKETLYLGILEQHKSVLFSAFHFAWKLGFRKFIFIGADHAYTNGMNHHSNDPVEKNRFPLMRITQDINGNPVITEAMYQSIGDSISAMAFFIKRRDSKARIINATGCGVMKEYMEIMDLEKAYEEVRK